jgi:hypothetical protein
MYLTKRKQKLEIISERVVLLLHGAIKCENKYHTVETAKSNKKIVERGKIDTPSNHIHDHTPYMQIC